jgi:hypothetical protein
MTLGQWIEMQMDYAWKERSMALHAMEVENARYEAFKQVLDTLPVAQMEVQIAAEDAAKE